MDKIELLNGKRISIYYLGCQHHKQSTARGNCFFLCGVDANVHCITNFSTQTMYNHDGIAFCESCGENTSNFLHSKTQQLKICVSVMGEKRGQNE